MSIGDSFEEVVKVKLFDKYSNTDNWSTKKYSNKDKILMEFKERFKNLRKSIGYTQIQFGELFGLTQVSISELESGRNKPSKTLMAYLKYRYSNIFGEDEKIGKTENITNNGNVTKVFIEHQDIIKRFKNPERGLLINQRIIDIQDTSEELFDRLDLHIETIHSTAEILKKEAKKKSQQTPSTKWQANGK